MRLEIGFGGAEHLIAQARNNPRIGFIGSDAFINGVAKALAAIDEHKLINIRLHFGDASELLDWLPADALDAHRPALSRSVAETAALEAALHPGRQSGAARRAFLRSGGELRFATDIGDYAAYALARVLRSKDFVWTAECADDWRKPWVGFSRTRYEAKAIREGRTPAYFIFRRV